MSAAPGVVGFGHLHLLVSDIDRSTEFYVERLGFVAEPAVEGRAVTAFRQGLALVGGRKAKHKQVDELAFPVTDVRKLRTRLKAAGVPLLKDLHAGPGGLAILVEDPDGTRLALFEAGAPA